MTLFIKSAMRYTDEDSYVYHYHIIIITYYISSMTPSELKIYEYKFASQETKLIQTSANLYSSNTRGWMESVMLYLT